MPIIELQNVGKYYQQGPIRVEALKDISLTVQQGEFVSIMGPSGSGKSTLLNVIGCLDRPSTGIYRLAGEQVNQLSDWRLAKVRNQFIGFIFQQFRLLADLDAQANVELPLVYRGVPGHKRRQIAGECLAAVGLYERRKHRPAQLSGGEQQRVAIARALAAEPLLLLADEPTGALDSRTSISIMSIFQRLNQERKITIVQVTHERDIALCGNRIIHILDGGLERDESVDRPIVAQISGGGEG